MKKWWLLAILAVMLLALVWMLARPVDAPVSDSALLPLTDKVVRGDLRLEVTSTGIIQPINKVEIKSKASGMIEELKIEESDQVKKGDLIARLDQRDTKNAYDQAVADLDVAEATVKQKDSDFTRKKELFDKGLISATDYDVAKLAMVDAQAQLVRARISLDNNDIKLKDTIVRSPIDGVVLTKDVEEGQIISSGISSVSGGTLIATVAEMDNVYVKADIDEVDIGKIQPGMLAKISADAFPEQIFEGDVIRIAAQSKTVNNVTTFEVTIMVKNPSRRLKAGMNTSVDILVADKKNVLMVPNEALMTQKDMAQEIARLQAMTTGQSEANGQAYGRPLGGPAGGRPTGGGRQARTETALESTELRRGVIIKTDSGFEPRMVQTGISNFDFTEILEGVQEGDQVVYSYYSRAKQAGSEMRQRMSQRSQMESGFRSSSQSTNR